VKIVPYDAHTHLKPVHALIQHSLGAPKCVGEVAIAALPLERAVQGLAVRPLRGVHGVQVGAGVVVALAERQSATLVAISDSTISDSTSTVMAQLRALSVEPQVLGAPVAGGVHLRSAFIHVDRLKMTNKQHNQGQKQLQKRKNNFFAHLWVLVVSEVGHELVEAPVAHVEVVLQPLVAADGALHESRAHAGHIHHAQRANPEVAQHSVRGVQAFVQGLLLWTEEKVEI